MTAIFSFGLLPGPRDRDGLPESLRFWKSRIEPGDHEDPFAVGLLCGPSGSGKSSMVKAGLLCRLAPADVIAVTVYVEASPGATETQSARCTQRVADGQADSLEPAGSGRGECEVGLYFPQGPKS